MIISLFARRSPLSDHIPPEYKALGIDMEAYAWCLVLRRNVVVDQVSPPCPSPMPSPCGTPPRLLREKGVLVSQPAANLRRSSARN